MWSRIAAFTLNHPMAQQARIWVSNVIAFMLVGSVGWFWLGVARGDEKNLTYPLNKLNRKKRVR